VESAEIRRRFLAHFERNGHTVVPSAPLPFDDPNLLFVNAGMVQFVPYFIGQQAPPWPRATSIQKCIRTQDIDEVGKPAPAQRFLVVIVDQANGARYITPGAVALHASRREKHMHCARASRNYIQNVPDGGAGWRGNNTNAPRKNRQGAFQLAGEQSFSLQSVTKLLESNS